MCRLMTTLSLLSLLGLAVTGCDDAPDDADMGPVEETWSVAFDATDDGALLSVWGPSDDRLWAVGGQPETGVVWQYADGAWAKAAPPEGPLINWVHGAGDVEWFVGDGGRALRRVGGGDWETFETGTEAPLWGVFAVSADEAWAVGGQAIDDGNPPDPVITHYKDGAWTRVAVPAVDRDFRALFKVWGRAADDVWAVGAKGVILHWDGAAWSQQGSGTGEDLISLFGVGDAVAIVGGRSNGVLSRLTADGWDTRVLAGNPGFNGIWMQPDGTAWVAGNRGLLLSIPPDSYEPTRHRSDTREVLHGIWGTPSGHRLAVGGSLDTSPPWIGIALEAGR